MARRNPHRDGDGLDGDAWRWAARRLAAGDAIDEIAATLRMPVAMLRANCEADSDLQRLVGIYRKRLALGEEAREERVRGLLWDAFELQLESGRLAGLSWLARLLFGGFDKLRSSSPKEDSPKHSSTRPAGKTAAPSAGMQGTAGANGTSGSPAHIADDQLRLMGVLPDPPPVAPSPANDVAAAAGATAAQPATPPSASRPSSSASGGGSAAPASSLSSGNSACPGPDPGSAGPRMDGRDARAPFASSAGSRGGSGGGSAGAAGSVGPAPHRAAGPLRSGPEGRPPVEPARDHREAARPATALEGRVTRLLDRSIPKTLADLDLADAICSLRFHSVWPPYAGVIDLAALHDALGHVELDQRTLQWLASAELANEVRRPHRHPASPLGP